MFNLYTKKKKKAKRRKKFIVGLHKAIIKVGLVKINNKEKIF